MHEAVCRDWKLQAEIKARQPHHRNTRHSHRKPIGRIEAPEHSLSKGGDILRGVLLMMILCAAPPDCRRAFPHQRSDESSTPAASTRWTNEWDNPNGSIERGRYAGPSISLHRRQGPQLTSLALPRMVSASSVPARHNHGCTINNANANIDLLLS